MLPKTMQDAINEQIEKEYHSSYLYLAMAAYCEASNLPGSATWMRVQSREELTHAMKLFEHPELIIGMSVSMLIGAVWIHKIVNFDF